ncbi:LpqB family beta-propeller domain-containing protein [Microbacterium hydrocarbonoxydans]|uniref:LpqB family beta-propeller domain-containing protein n=1 Tax=Microbacterium hydrocarbonoxydans TaxID=273678 RepID=UPI0007BC6DFF|nr:LpqB family beta-propeller domain-containing protein [Microbacterium hydrocarbonoxydans]GAT72678.1 hypothetical protein MHM582_1154 [Microbacterium sp. HM58-2]
MSARRTRPLRALAAAALALALSACAGLPTSGDVQSGLPLGTSPEEPGFLLLASGPADGAGPADIVEGFLEAAITPADRWSVARSFLTRDYESAWRPGAGVLIDVSAESRAFTSSVEDGADREGDGEDEVEAEEGDTAEVVVQVEQVARLDEAGAYSEELGTSTLPFEVTFTGGQWRISKAPDGVVIDESRFGRVYDDYPLQYFDSSWKRLVPDVRWLPRRVEGIATAITQSLIGGAPSEWLESAVQTAFPPDVQLARDAVPIDSDQVADVALNSAAATLDQVTLARMRTQLQSTLEAAGVHVSQVRFSVDGRNLEAGVVPIGEEPEDTGAIVLTADAFGTLVGGEITPIEGVSEDILRMPRPITSIDVAADDSFAAVQLADGHVYRAGAGQIDAIDERPGLIRPAIDPYGFTWTVPARSPGALQISGSDVDARPVDAAWPGASEISSIRVAGDGARVAAVVTVGGQRWVAVAAVTRDEGGAPTALGEPKPVTELSGPAKSLVWLGPDRLGVLTEPEDAVVLTQIVGGTGVTETAPADAVALAGARTASGVRVLDAEGAVFARSGSAWRESTEGVLVLATRAGY